jgi:hypothetical protein
MTVCVVAFPSLLMISMIISCARATDSAAPLMSISRAWPSGKFWLIVIRALEAVWRLRMVSPPRPMMRPTICEGQLICHGGRRTGWAGPILVKRSSAAVES